MYYVYYPLRTKHFVISFPAPRRRPARLHRAALKVRHHHPRCSKPLGGQDVVSGVGSAAVQAPELLLRERVGDGAEKTTSDDVCSSPQSSRDQLPCAVVRITVELTEFSRTLHRHFDPPWSLPLRLV
jgi:hypothetical protein